MSGPCSGNVFLCSSHCKWLMLHRKSRSRTSHWLDKMLLILCFPWKPTVPPSHYNVLIICSPQPCKRSTQAKHQASAAHNSQHGLRQNNEKYISHECEVLPGPAAGYQSWTSVLAQIRLCLAHTAVLRAHQRLGACKQSAHYTTDEQIANSCSCMVGRAPDQSCKWLTCASCPNLPGCTKLASNT